MAGQRSSVLSLANIIIFLVTNFLIAPIYRDNISNRVTLPEGRWRYFFDDEEIIEGPAKFEREFPLAEYPVYIREGAIVPMDIKREYTGIGNRNSEGYLTLLIYPDGKNEFTVHHPDRSGSTKVMVEDTTDRIRITLTDLHKPHILDIKLASKPRKVELDNAVLSDSVDYKFDMKRNKLIIKTDTYKTGEYTIFK